MPVTVSRCRLFEAVAPMSKQKRWQLAVLLLSLLCSLAVMQGAGANSTEVLTGKFDPDSGLAIDKHWQLVKAHCSACHSPRLVTQNRGSRQTWLAMIRWMQDSQGLWAFDPATETAILDYLEKNYAPSAVHRRAPIKRSLMPVNPYGKVD